jgi:hypothetical protein
MTELDTDILCVFSHRKPTLTVTGMVCAQHLADLRDLLADITELYALLPYADRPATEARNSESKHSKNPDPAAPVNLTRLALTDPRNPSTVARTYARNFDQIRGTLASNGPDLPDIPNVLAAWCQQITDERNTTVPAGTVTQAVDGLRRHLPWVCAQTWVTDLEDELRACRRALAMAVGETPGPTPLCDCPYCGNPLYTDRQREQLKLRRNGQSVEDTTERHDRVTCPTCYISWAGVEMLRLKLIAEAG